MPRRRVVQRFLGIGAEILMATSALMPETTSSKRIAIGCLKLQTPPRRRAFVRELINLFQNRCGISKLVILHTGKRADNSHNAPRTYTGTYPEKWSLEENRSKIRGPAILTLALLRPITY